MSRDIKFMFGNVLQRLVARDLYSTVLRSRHRKGRNTLVKVQLQCFAMPCCRVLWSRLRKGSNTLVKVQLQCFAMLCCRVLKSRHRKREETRRKAITGFSFPQLQNAPLIMLQSWNYGGHYKIINLSYFTTFPLRNWSGARLPLSIQIHWCLCRLIPITYQQLDSNQF